MTIDIREHTPGRDIDAFLRAPHALYEGDPFWVPPLEMDMRKRLTPGKNPFLEHADLGLFTAWKQGRIVGRCSAQVDHEHMRRYGDDVGFFGFFDTTDDPDVAKALIDTAGAWLRRRGMKRMRGPLSLSMNEEVGMLVDGFDSPPMILMPYHRRYQSELAERAGLVKERDLFAWRYDVHEVPPRARKAWEEIQAMPEVTIRPVRLSRMQREVETILEIFNDAWSGNWGFVPATPAEARVMAEELRLIVDPSIALIAEIDGRPVAVCVALPNLNEAIWDLGGRLRGAGLLKLLWRLKVRRLNSARLMMLGIRRELRGVKKYGGLSMAIYCEVIRRGSERGYTWGELSWTLEDNTPINLGIKAMGGKVYKRYRLFERALTA